MDRRDISRVLLAGGLGALAARTASAQTSCSSAPCYPQTSGEPAVVNTSLRPGTVGRYATPAEAFLSTKPEVSFGEGFFAYPSATIDVNANTNQAIRLCRVSGPGHLQQLAANQDLLIIDSPEPASFVLDGVTFTGYDNGTRFGLAPSTNKAVTIRNRSGVVISGCTFQYWRYYALLLENCNDVTIIGNRFFRCPYPIRLRNCQRVTIVGNNFSDAYLQNGVFGVGVGLESNDPIGGAGGPVFAPCRQVTIIGNTFDSLFNSQGVLVHAGMLVTISGNTFRNVALPVSLNPATASDSIQRVSITGNVIESADVSPTPYTNGDIGINCQGGPVSSSDPTPTPSPTEITIADNVINSANRVLAQAAFGAIRVGYARSVLITNNKILQAYGNGILCSDSDQVSIAGNMVSDIAPAQGVRRGIRIAGATRAMVAGNHFFDIAGIGISNVSSGIQIQNNLFSNVTTTIST